MLVCTGLGEVAELSGRVARVDLAQAPAPHCCSETKNNLMINYFYFRNLCNKVCIFILRDSFCLLGSTILHNMLIGNCRIGFIS